MRRIGVAVVLTIGVLTAPLAAGRSSRGQCRTSACWSGSQHLIRLPRPFGLGCVNSATWKGEPLRSSGATPMRYTRARSSWASTGGAVYRGPHVRVVSPHLWLQTAHRVSRL